MYVSIVSSNVSGISVSSCVLGELKFCSKELALVAIVVLVTLRRPRRGFQNPFSPTAISLDSKASVLYVHSCCTILRTFLKTVEVSEALNVSK